MSGSTSPSTRPSDQGGWSPKRAIVHAVVWIVLLAVAAATAQTLGKVVDPARFQDGLVRAAFFVGLIGFASSYLLDTGRRLAGRVLQGFLGLLIVGLALLPLVVSRSGGPEPLTDAERQPLVTVANDGDSRLEHPTLGFSIAHPGPGFAAIDGIGAQQLEAHWRQYPEMYGTGWQNVPAAQTVYVMFAKGVDNLDAMLGLTEGLRESLVGTGNVEVLDNRLDEEALVAHFEGLMQNGLYIEMRAEAVRLTDDEIPFVVIVLGVSPQRGALSHVLDSLSPS